MNRQNVTCGPLYRRVRELFTGDAPELNRAFAQGFTAGEAEKVYLGACKAAMFRPTSSIGRELLRSWVSDICGVYGLCWTTLEYVDPSRDGEAVYELWICRDNDAVDAVESTTAIEVNSLSWHHWRGLLTGVADGEIDLHFHERQSAGDIDGTLAD